MKILADQVFATLGLPWDSKLSNLVLDEDRMIVESIPEYLLRVDLNSRYLGLSPIILFPAGTYEINDFLEQCKNGPIYWRQYVFDTTIEDIGLVELIITAAQGIQGIAGGEQGPQGIIGSQGIIGEASQGTQGLQGDLGVQGRMGTFGLQGIQGLRGSQGLVGYGAQGALGDVTEVQGIQGNPGIQGHVGTVGLQGIQGLRGSQGTSIQGTQGLLGIQGFRGLQGIQGPTGERGAETFLDLTDSPSAYTGQSGKLVAVASGEGGLEFVDAPSGEDNYVDGATFSGTTRDLTLTRTGDLEDITVNIPCCDPTEVIQGAVTNIEYGALYNWWAANDARNIAPAGWHIPTDAEYVILREYLDPLGNHIENIAGTKLKETGLTHWQTGGGTNDVGFNARGSGVRNDQGSFSGLTIGIYLWNSTPYPYNQVDGYHGFIYDGTTWFRIGLTSASKKSGNSIRLIKDDTTDTGTMVGNDGKVYPTVTIGSQVWMAANSAETKYRNGDLISNHGETYTDKYTNAEWAALTTEAMCWYDDNPDNGYTDVAVIQHNALGGIQGGSTTERYHHTKDEIDTHIYEAPEDGKQYARKDGAWEEVVAGEGTGTVVEINSAGDLVLNPGESNEETYTPPCSCDPLDMIEGATTNVKYGYLYNWWAATDVRNIAPAGWHIPTRAEWQTLVNYIDLEHFGDYGGGPIKEIGYTYWNSPNVGATNEFGFNARGNGNRLSNGNYSYIKDMGFWWTATDYSESNAWNRFVQTYDASIQENGSYKKSGYGLRLIKDDSINTDTMTGNDGKIYPTVKIGNQVWMAANLTETRYRNGDLISGPTFTNGEWAALTTEAYCIYDDNPENAGVDKITLRHNLLAEIQGGTLTERYHHTKAEADTHVYEAPIDGDAYVRKNGDWEIAATGIAIGDWTEDISFDFNDVEAGIAQTWILDIKASFAYKILSVVLQSDSTMDDVTVEIAGSPITWADDSVSIDVTTAVSDTAAKTDVDNDVAVGEQVTLVKSATDGDPTVIRGKLRIKRVWNG